MVKDML